MRGAASAVDVRAVGSIPRSVDVVVVGWYADRPGGPGVDEVRGAGIELDLAVAATPAFRGELDDAPLVRPPATAGQPTCVIVGLGPQGSAGPARVRDAAQRAANACRGRDRVCLALGRDATSPTLAAAAAAEGFLLGCYAAPRRSRRPDPAGPWPSSVTVLVAPKEARRATVTRELAHATAAAGQANWVRALVDTPAGDLSPAHLAEEITAAVAGSGARCRVWSAATIRKRGFGALLAVGRASRQPPQVVELSLGLTTRELTTRGPTTRAALGLVGKGVTFDSGGLNLKRDPDEIVWMKSDMAGAAACAGAVIAAARLGLTTPVRAVLPLVENLPGGDAVRPGDVVTHPDGSTTEITDTDSEGRLILADALAHLASTSVSGIIDVATLTDAAGFGPALWAAASSDDDLCAEVLAAGERAGEPGWRIPLVADYAHLLHSPVADSVNAAAGTPDTTVLAATYLRQFVADVPWVHIDNGSTAYLERPWAGWSSGATGSPVRTLLQLLRHRAEQVRTPR
jgi:leucyl aminopeptidase